MTEVKTQSLLVRRGVIATTGALAGNLALLAGGQAAGVRFAVTSQSESGSLLQIGVGAVALSTLLPLVAGLGAAAVLVHRWPPTRLGLTALAVVITFASLGMPLSAAADTGTGILLAVMHLVVGGAYVVALRGIAPVSKVTAHADAEAATAAATR